MILVADDDADILKLVSMILEQAGYRTVRVSNGKQALEKVRLMPGRFRLAILDLIMPELGGHEAAREILGLESGIALLFISGYVPETADLLPGQLLRKPFTSKQLLEAVHALLKQAS